MKLEDLRKQIGVMSTEDLRKRVAEIRTNRRNVPEKKAAVSKAKTTDAKLESLDTEGLEALLKVLEGL